MRAIAHGWRPPGRKDVPSKAVATEFMRADEARKKGKRSRTQVAEHKRATSAWAEGK